MTRKQRVLWISVLMTSLCYAVSIAPELDGVKDYEVIRPVRLHTLYRRDMKSSRPDMLKYAATVEGKDVVIRLEKNEGLLDKGYSETTYTKDGVRVTSTPRDLDYCYYHGRIVNDSESVVSMSTCDGLRGYIRTAEQQYLIEPLSGGDSGDHALFRYEALNETTPPLCGVTNTSWETDYTPVVSKARSRGSGRSFLQQQKYVQLYLVADNRAYQKMSNNQNDLRKRVFEIVNYVNVVYKPLNTFIALIGLEIWTDQDKITVTPPAGATLDAFTNWRNSYLVKNQPHDNAQLLTGIDFEGATVGLAFVGSMCSAHSTGVIQDHSSKSIAVGATLAHEMGHNLGMNHDTSSCVCPSSSCIMSAALSYDIPKLFSSCSDTSFEQFLSSRATQCVFDKPDYATLVTPPVCGNGFLEKGEACDCGTPEECTNPCCNATACTLTAGSECADGECCASCKLMPSSQVCRQQKDVCDLAEYCTGTSNICPEDVFSVNGIPCNDGQGYCYNGQCPVREAQCVKVWGDTAIVAQPSCYRQNTRGVYYGFCNRPSKDQFIGCQEKDIMCGKLYCNNGNDNPNYNRLVMFPGCKAIFSDNPDTDYSLVDTGTKCGDGMVCKDHECMDLEMAYRATNCSARCKGHGVCNHRKECQCEPGWLPPDCDRTNGSQTFYTAIVIAIVVILLVLIIAGGVGFFLFKNKHKAPRSRRPAYPKGNQGTSNPGFSQPSAPAQYRVEIQHPKKPPPPPPTYPKPKSQPVDLVAARQALRPPTAPRV